MALDSLAVEPGHGTAEKADHRWLLIIRQDLHVGQPCGVNRFAEAGGNDSDMDLVVADAVGAALRPVAGHPVPHLPEPDQVFQVD